MERLSTVVTASKRGALIERAGLLPRRQSDDELLTFIRQGLAANHPTNASGVSMPPSAGQPNLTDAEILAVVQHLRTNQAIN